LGDLLAAAINANGGAWQLSPMATEIERQTVRWIAELMGYPADCGGLLVSGGNMANFVGFLAARKAQAQWDIRSEGLRTAEAGQLCVYTSKETHTWVEKAADLYGLGTNAIRWIPTDDRLRMDTAILRQQVAADREAGNLPFLVVGTAGSVSTGAIDPLPELAAFCREQELWFHVDGAYGGFAAMLPDASADLKGLAEADSVAVDPHKWLYAPLEAGCVLVRNPEHLRDAFSFHPPYYRIEGEQDDPPTNFHYYGPQNSRGFRALKVWLALQQAGMDGYVQMISDDIELARHLYQCVDAHPELQAFTQGLSITTFRYVPHGVENEPYLNELNTALVHRIQDGGEAFISNAVINGVFLLRACIVNFRTTMEDIEALPEIVTRIGGEIHAEMQRTIAPGK
jgi:glutamate/tyrosine decarboxylase-like PLP-dependent enzyme